MNYKDRLELDAAIEYLFRDCPAARTLAEKLMVTITELVDVLKSAVDCGMVPTSSASDGGAAKYSRQVQVADMIRAAINKYDHKS